MASRNLTITAINSSYRKVNGWDANMNDIVVAGNAGVYYEGIDGYFPQYCISKIKFTIPTISSTYRYRYDSLLFHILLKSTSYPYGISAYLSDRDFAITDIVNTDTATSPTEYFSNNILASPSRAYKDESCTTQYADWEWSKDSNPSDPVYFKFDLSNYNTDTMPAGTYYIYLMANNDTSAFYGRDGISEYNYSIALNHSDTPIYNLNVNYNVDGSNYGSGNVNVGSFTAVVNGVTVASNVIDLNYNAIAGTPYSITVTEKNGYKYIGSNPLTGTYPSSDFEVTLNFRSPKTISYNANGGTGGPVGNTTAYYDVETILSTSKPERTGYTFLGWSTDKDASSASYSAGGKITVTSNTTLYAIWAINSYYLNVNGAHNDDWSAVYGTFDLYINGSYVTTTSGHNTKYTYGTRYEVRNIVGANGYHYVSGTNLSGTIGAGDVTVNLSFALNTYTVSYNANTGSGAPSNQTKTHGIDLILSNVQPIKQGYEFIGWSTDPAAKDPMYIAGGSFDIDKDTTLYAIYKPMGLSRIIIDGKQVKALVKVFDGSKWTQSIPRIFDKSKWNISG